MRIRRDRRWERSLRPAHDAAVTALHAGVHDFAALRAGLAASPYYREVLAARGLAPSDLQSAGDLAVFPLLDRAILAERWRDLAVVDGDGDLVVVHSSGSTGVPVSIVRRADESLHMWAVIRFFVERLGITVPPRPRVVLLCALPDGPEYSAHLPLLGDGALHRVSVRRAERLAGRVAPAIVTGDPESLRWLAEHPVFRPQVIFSSALHLPGDLRAALPAPVVNLYSTTETGPIAWQDGDVFRVLASEVVVESLDGELVVTRLRAGATPILRYRTGDRGRVDGGVIRDFQGRRACYFTAPDGRAVDAWQLAPLLRDLPLRAFRVTQTAVDRFTVEAEGDLTGRVARGLTLLGWAQPTVTAAPPPAHPAKPEPFVSAVSR